MSASTPTIIVRRRWDDPQSAPHELELCVLERDNVDVYAALRRDTAALITHAKVSASN
jgi:hypothetical protein